MEDSHGGGGRWRKEACDLQENEVWDMIKAREGSSSNSNTRNKLESSPPSSPPLSLSVNAATTDDISTTKGAARDSPGWSKIIKKKMKKKLWDDDVEMMGPPHEYLARRVLETTQMASHSMCEGVGRTLKGRDLSKMRDAILTKTGFIE